MPTGHLPKRVEDFLSWQAKASTMRKEESDGVEPGPFVTLSRSFGCEGVPLAQRIAEKLNEISPEPTPWVMMGKEVVEAIAEKLGEAGKFVEALSESRRSFVRQTVETLFGGKLTEYQAYSKLAETLVSLAEAGRVVLLGRGSAVACAGLPRGTHVRLTAPLSWRASKLAQEKKIGVPEAEAEVNRGEASRESFVRDFTGNDAADPLNYDLVLNNDRLSVEEMAEIVVSLMRARGHV